MKILGIDPGTTTVGFGIIKKEANNLKLVDFGTIVTKPKIPQPQKLLEIYQDLNQILKNQKPDLVGIEKVFFFKNSKTATSVGEAKGVIILAAKISKIPILELTPLQVKNAVCCSGRAQKGQIQKMIKTILGLKNIPRSDDAADALAVAICAANFHQHK